jgi:iron complex transport system permease protein
MILLSTGLLTAIATAYCGPVAFLGLATPHIARLMLNTSNHLQVLPVTILTGATMALACNLICIIPPVMIPLNAVTPIFGVPVILYIIFRKAE